MTTSRGFYLVITVVLLLDIAKCSIIGNRYFRNNKLWTKPGSPITEPTDKWIEQKLDHFDSNEKRTWKQRYFVNEELVNDHRDVAFLRIGEELEVYDFQIYEGAYYSYAQKFEAIIFNLEHRYYGASHPTENLSTENLKYLSSKQALADLAFFIESMNKQYNLSADVKWIVFGGGYGGSLAAWARLLHPNLVHGAVSITGPLLAKVDFDGRQWFYQMCTEFAFFQTSSHDPHVFGNRFGVDLYIQQCQDVFGPEFNKTFVEKAVAATNELYQGLDINVTNTVFVHGSKDPWHPLGIYETRSKDAPAILLDGFSHISTFPSEDETPDVAAARAKIQELISQWLKN